MVATVSSRRLRSAAPGVSNGRLAWAMHALARVVRCSMALSLTKKARAICATLSPDTMRSASAICCRRQFRMATDEQQPQQIVAVVRAVQAFDQGIFRIVEVGQYLIGGQRLEPAMTARCVERGIASDQDEPRRRITRRAVLAPVLQGSQAGFLIGLFGRVHVAEVAHQRGDRLGTGGGQRGVEHEPRHRAQAAGVRTNHAAGRRHCSAAAHPG
jgi:hypothetical protein